MIRGGKKLWGTNSHKILFTMFSCESQTCCMHSSGETYSNLHKILFSMFCSMNEYIQQKITSSKWIEFLALMNVLGCAA